MPIAAARKLHDVSSQSPATIDAAALPPHARSGHILTIAAWPLALLLIVHRIFVVALNGTPTDDFTTVFNAVRRFLDGQPVYDQAYNHVDPLYLYNPGATLLLSPLGMADFSLARGAFICANALAICAALAILTTVVGYSLRGPVFPVALVAAFATEAVINTLAFTNINGLLLLALSVFLWGILQSRRGPRVAAGIAIGLAILIKPQFAPLLFLPLVKKDWINIAGGVAVPVLFNAIAWPLVPGASGYLDNLVPYLGTTRDYANASWPGVQAYFGLSPTAYYPLWIALGVCTALSILGLLKWRESEPVFWALTTSGAIMVGIFFLSSLGQQYYSMWLFPMLFTVLLPRSVFHTWGAWAAAFFFLAPVEWSSTHWPVAGSWMTVFTATIGWGLLIVVTAASTIGWWREPKVKR
ncbi:arabinofuranosyl transferase C [Corynebacterium striatum]|nr:arabinofuranosyl transferase C [Corynebacterium striatum]